MKRERVKVPLWFIALMIAGVIGALLAIVMLVILMT